MQTRIGIQQIGIMIITVATAIVHLTLAVGAYNQNDITTTIMFTLNGLAYLALLAATFLPLPVAKDYPKLVRWAFIGFTAVTVLAWVLIGARNILAYVDKLFELTLIALLWLEVRNV